MLLAELSPDALTSGYTLQQNDDPTAVPAGLAVGALLQGPNFALPTGGDTLIVVPHTVYSVAEIRSLRPGTIPEPLRAEALTIGVIGTVWRLGSLERLQTAFGMVISPRRPTDVNCPALAGAWARNGTVGLDNIGGMRIAITSLDGGPPRIYPLRADSGSVFVCEGESTEMQVNHLMLRLMADAYERRL